MSEAFWTIDRTTRLDGVICTGVAQKLTNAFVVPELSKRHVKLAKLNPQAPHTGIAQMSAPHQSRTINPRNGPISRAPNPAMTLTTSAHQVSVYSSDYHYYSSRPRSSHHW